MKELTYRITGRLSTLFDRMYYSFGVGARDRNRTGEKGFDRTGLVAGRPRPLKVFRSEDGVVYAEYDSLYFSLWRSQELTLFSRHMDMFKRPVADLGCGDGSFGSVLFKEVDYGIDNDPDALNSAAAYGVYRKLLRDLSGIESESIRSVYSNSVLEHVSDLDQVLSEVKRVLMPGCVFIFTVPVKRYEKDLERYFGKWYSDLINRLSYHHNMFEPDVWKSMVERKGFVVEELIYYQPGWFTYCDYMLRFFSDKSLGILVPGIGKRILGRYRKQLLDMVRRSVLETKEDGGNIFILAKKSV